MKRNLSAKRKKSAKRKSLKKRKKRNRKRKSLKKRKRLRRKRKKTLNPNPSPSLKRKKRLRKKRKRKKSLSPNPNLNLKKRKKRRKTIPNPAAPPVNRSWIMRFPSSAMFPTYTAETVCQAALTAPVSYSRSSSTSASACPEPPTRSAAPAAA